MNYMRAPAVRDRNKSDAFSSSFDCPKSTVPSSAILVGSVAAEQSYCVLGMLVPEFPILGGGGGV